MLCWQKHRLRGPVALINQQRKGAGTTAQQKEMGTKIQIAETYQTYSNGGSALDGKNVNRAGTLPALLGYAMEAQYERRCRHKTQLITYKLPFTKQLWDVCAWWQAPTTVLWNLPQADFEACLTRCAVACIYVYAYSMINIRADKIGL
jgi:hypothetical protein